MIKAIEIRARRVLGAAIDSFVETFVQRAMLAEAEYLQNKVVSRAVLVRFWDGSAMVARVGVVFGPVISHGRIVPDLNEDGELRITERMLLEGRHEG